jgi:HD-GYP domain-containing protein (c-di-GMP phosphodiesterase class II)
MYQLKVKVETTHLQIGMYVADFDRRIPDNPFPAQGFVIRTGEEIRKLKELFDYVYVDKRRSSNPKSIREMRSGPENLEYSVDDLDINKAEQAKKILGNGKPLTDIPQPEPTNEFKDELYKARKIYRRLFKEADKIYESIDNSTQPDLVPVLGILLEVLASIQQNPSAFQWLALTNPDDKSVRQHCINVCVLAMHFAYHINLPDKHIRTLGMAGLTFDIGKLLISNDILYKPSHLTDGEMSIMQKHAKAGADILEASNWVPSEVVNVALKHHEHLDGSGYPNQLKGEAIDLLSRIIRIIDSYNAIISSRHYSSRQPTSHALNELYTMRNTVYDGDLVEAFIRVCGMYPVGTLVETHTGEIGFVIANNMKNRLSPTVMLVRDAHNQPYEKEQFVDFATALDGNGHPKYSIKQPLNPAEYEINVKDFFRD